jgi:hypothetical protein
MSEQLFYRWDKEVRGLSMYENNVILFDKAKVNYGVSWHERRR